ncbi:hypothetical protein DTO013E5_6814 [Penicillium roqueforti]|uniref:uncharacterized protein n=1 Tax=Penicillium roqueforti TaxID=5082 RepID=UPI00190E163B|nr:uncharacterized protein LCP9604111_8232 [Penicillium roqueforti]KAF9241959.1 hypothetical protein LCP9604111_8232 [Penicillium roqueforti]KAI1829588.1 hypothetical protein CBS147337_9595 [Penicillium roqueforti]KAI2679829.1 hypothetical protein CBS147355_4311 [Penicillium roqueforti]KAI2684256.1 hypothetical protein LCP963914a_5556 [Penicillium roqueforti]KAI2697431.1 hypothetical protein CBS147372_7791 [Penicillium roqueforti]
MLFLSILPLLAFGLVCFAHPLEKRQSTSTDSFKLYAYGTGISGLPVFYRNGTAQVADVSKVDTTTMAAMTPINFTAATDNTWVAHPISSSSATADFTTLSTDTNMLCLDQGDTADSNPVGFTGASAADQSTTTKLSNVWSTYGGYVLVTVSGANFYARQADTDGVYSLLWSSSAEAMTDTIPLVLRTTEPATVSVLT